MVETEDIILDYLLGIVPEGWQVNRIRDWLVTSNGRVLIEGHALNQRAMNIRQHINIFHTKSEIDLSQLEYNISGGKKEYLGTDQWGHVYIEIGPKSDKLWPKAKEEIIKALEIKIK